MEGPRALVLAHESDKVLVIKRLARAVLKFQDIFLSQEEGRPAGLLCQVRWHVPLLPIP